MNVAKQFLVKAKEDIDFRENLANQQKMPVFKEAKARTHQLIDQITEKLAELATEDEQRSLQLTIQTVEYFDVDSYV